MEKGKRVDGFQVVVYAQAPQLDGRAYSTLGLSWHHLASRTSGKIIHQELLLILSGVKPRHAVDLLQRVAARVYETHSPLLYGDVVGAKGPVLPKTRMEGLYV